MSNVEFGSPKVSVEISYRGIGKSQMVLQKSAMKELRRYLSFTQLRFHDNSELAGICKDWGRLASKEYFVGKWGHGEEQNRLYWYPVLRKGKYHLRVQLDDVDILEKMDCDDDSRNTNDTNGDFWRVFVR